MSKIPRTIHVLYEYSSGETPHGCSLIRLLRPLSHPTLAPHLTLSFGTELPDIPPDLVIIERFWNQRCDNAQLDDLLARLRQQGIAVLAELDDDLLSLGMCPEEASGPAMMQKMWLRRLLRAADGVIVSTPSLAERVRNLNPVVEVVPNALDERLFQSDRTTAVQNSRRVTLGYMGTYTHIGDLLSIIGPLCRVLARHGRKVALELVGVGATQRLEEAFRGIPVTIRQVPPADVHYENFPAWMRANIRWDFGIAPLVDTAFSRSKSDIKFLDYAVQGIPGIFSRVPAYSSTVRHLQNGLLAGSPAEWEAALDLMVTDRVTRHQLAAAACSEVWEGRMLQKQAKRWLEAITNILASPANSVRWLTYSHD